MRRATWIAMVTALLLLAVPALALGATRYASPSGSSSADCTTPATACDLPTAIENARSGDDVIVLAGSYTVSTGIGAFAGVSLTGEPGPSPVIHMGANTFLGSYRNNGADHSTVSNLDIEATGATEATLDVDQGALATHLLIRFAGTASSGPPGSATAAILAGGGATLADSAIAASGPGVSGVGAAPESSANTAAANLINDTVYATGAGSVGVNAISSCMTIPIGPGTTIYESGSAALENVIAHGDGGGVGTTGSGSGCTPPQSSIAVSYSNYNPNAAVVTNGPVTDGGHNQTAAAHTSPSTLFVSPPANLRERPGATTIDAGSTTGIEATDLDNTPRVHGRAPDMGAYEFVPAPSSIRCVVPKLKGKTLNRARRLLAAAHCALGQVKRPKHHRGKLVVKAQSPAAGSVLADGASVAVKLRPKPHHKKRH